jgi:hypothetical protein
MKKRSAITSVETKTAFQEKLVEKFVQQNLPPQAPKENKIAGIPGFASRYKEVECCAAELPVNGTVEIFYSVKNPEAIRRISHPVSSRFIVFCAREEGNDYKVAWASSLS